MVEKLINTGSEETSDKLGDRIGALVAWVAVNWNLDVDTSEPGSMDPLVRWNEWRFVGQD